MRNFQSLKTLFLISLFSVGCGSSPQPNGEPIWLTDPTQNGKLIGGVGSAGKHLNGESAQLKVAISRAIDMIASQMGVTVNTQMTTSKSIKNRRMMNSGLNTISFHTVDGVKVNGQIKATWRDYKNDKVYVWMVKND